MRRIRALAEAYVLFALAEPGLFRTAFHRAAGQQAAGSALGDGRSRAPGFADLTELTEYRPFRLLGAALDDLAACGLMPPVRRRGAEIASWAVVHGLAVLLLDGPPARLTPEQRGAALRATLDAVVLSLIRR